MTIFNLRNLLVILFFLISVSLQAQKVQHLWQDSSQQVPQVEWFGFCPPDSCFLAFERLLGSLHGQGFIEASLDSIHNQADTLKIAHWFVGKKYEWLQLQAGNVPTQVLEKAGVQLKKFKTFSFANLQQAQKSILTIYENEGYPFANIALSEITISPSGEISAQWLLDKNRLVLIDSLVVQGNAQMNKRFLSNYLEVKTGDVYNEKQLAQISKRLSELNFVKEIRPPQIEFEGEKAKVRTFLEKKPASQFDFVLGILPQSNNEDGIKITGDGLIELVNPFAMGEQLKIKYSSYPGKSRELQSSVEYPYLPFLPIGVDAKFNLYLQDTLFRTADAYLGFRYNLGGNNFVQFYYQNRSNALLGFDEALLKSTFKLPDILDITNQFYGLKYQYQQLNYRFNPTKGWDISLNTALGTKKIKKNAKIASLQNPNDENYSYTQLYDSLSLKNLQIRAEVKIGKFWKIGQLSTLLTQFQGAVIRNLQKQSNNKPNFIHQNEQYRIGGNQLLRGFDEQSIQADLYNVLTLEFRYLLARNSNAFLFTDLGNSTNLLRQNNNYRLDFPYSFGIGVNFETKAGIFGLSYAVGKQQGNPIQLKTAKIHFGYQNYF